MGEFWTPPAPKNRPPLSQRKGQRASSAPVTQTAPVPAGPPTPPTLSVVRDGCCPTCGLTPDGTVTKAVRADLMAMSGKRGIEPTLAAAALVLAGQIDDGGGEDGRYLAALTKELRTLLEQLLHTRRDWVTGGVPPAGVTIDDDWTNDLDQPV